MQFGCFGTYICIILIIIYCKPKLRNMNKTTSKTLKKPGKPTAKVAEETSKKNITQKVIVNRELKYVYPKGCIDTLARKAFRQKVRNALRKMERDSKKLEGKELKALEAKLVEYKNSVLA